MKQYIYCLIGACICIMFSLFAFLYSNIGMQTGWVVCIAWTLIAAKYAEQVDELEQKNFKLYNFIIHDKNEEIVDAIKRIDYRIDGNAILDAVDKELS